MARKKRTVTEVVDDMPEEIAAVDQQVDFDPDAQDVVEQLGGDVAKVLLYRTPKGGKPEYIETMPAGEFNLDYVAEEHGGGRYFVRLIGSDGQAIKTIAFAIAERRKPIEHGGSSIERMLERVLDRLDRQQAPSKDPMEIAASLGAVVSSQLQAMLGVLTPLLTRQDKGGMAASDILEAVELGIRLGGQDEGYLPVIREVGVPLVKALENITGARRPEGGVAVPAIATPAPSNGAPDWVRMIQPHMAKVLEFAQRGADPLTVASALDLQYPRLARWLEQAIVDDPAFDEKVFQYFPELASYRQWVTTLLGEFAPEPGNSVTDHTGEELDD